MNIVSLGATHNILAKEYNTILQLKPIIEPSEVVEIQSGLCSILVLTKNGQVYGKGLNRNGVLGLGNDQIQKNWTLIPLQKVKQISLQSHHTLFLTNDGHVYGCGDNENCQLGLPQSQICEPTLVSFFLEKPSIKDIQSKYYFTMVLLENGDLYGMGNVEYCGGNQNYPFPIQICLNNPIQSISCCMNSTLIRTINNEWYAFGSKVRGYQESYGKPIQETPERVDDLFPKDTQVEKIVSTFYSHFMLTTDKNLYTIGFASCNEFGLNVSTFPKWTLYQDKNFVISNVQSSLCNVFLYLYSE